MEYVLRNTLLTLLEQPDAMLADRPPRPKKFALVR
jgi:hypothetical protein